MMKISEFITMQDADTMNVFSTLDTLIRRYDLSVSAKIGSIMSVKQALVYKQDGVYKYGLTATKHHYSYHSMVMYVYPEVLADLKQKCTRIKFQKGCFNFRSLDHLDLKAFQSFLMKSARQDFTPVIRHCKSKK